MDRWLKSTGDTGTGKKTTRKHGHNEKGLVNSMKNYNCNIWASAFDTAYNPAGDLEKGQEYMDKVKQNETNQVVLDAIASSTKNMPGYLIDKVDSHCPGGTGSVWSDYVTVHQLRKANWEEVEHPEVMAGCRAFRTTDLPSGEIGVVEIDCLKPQTPILLACPPESDKLQAIVCIEEICYHNVTTEETWLIIGEHEGNTVVFTCHPGEPVRPSQLSAEDFGHLYKIIPANTALGLGLKYAKVER
jgi:hypothetical protein